MSRKIKSILLLLIFSVLVFHEMIPHHHHEHVSMETYEDFHSHENDCHEHRGIDSKKALCESRANLSKDKNHECPHHYHICNIDQLHYNHSVNSFLQKHFSHSSVLFTLQEKNNTKVFFNHLEHSNSNIQFKLNKRLRTGATILRAPPASA